MEIYALKMLKIAYNMIVNEEVYLHSDTEPRYKGASIPSKAFKTLQSMTTRASNMTSSSGRNMSCLYFLKLIAHHEKAKIYYLQMIIFLECVQLFFRI